MKIRMSSLISRKSLKNSVFPKHSHSYPSHMEIVHDLKKRYLLLLMITFRCMMSLSLLSLSHQTNLHASVTEYIRKCTSNFGKVKLVMRKNNFMLEVADDAYEIVLADPTVNSAQIELVSNEIVPMFFVLSTGWSKEIFLLIS